MIATILLIAQATAPTLHVRVDGEGYLRFVDQGRVVYAREADLTVRQGQIVHASGAALIPAVPCHAPTFTVDLEGNIVAGSTHIGKLVLALFEGETPQPNGAYLTATGRPKLGNPGEGLAGVIRTGEHSASTTTTAPQQAAPPREESRVEVRPANNTPVPEGHVRIHVRGNVVVSDNQTTLADIAEITGGNPDLGLVVITATPPIGVNRTLDVNYLKARVRPAVPAETEIEWAGANQVQIAREAQTISVEKILEVAHAAATGQTGATAFQNPLNLAPMVAPLGELTVIAERVSVSGTRITVQVAAMVDGRRAATRNVILTITSPVTSLRTGQAVTVRVVRNALIIELRGTVRQISPATNSVTVQTETGATLTGTLAADGAVEVKA
jgi:hypothetical protein